MKKNLNFPFAKNFFLSYSRLDRRPHEGRRVEEFKRTAARIHHRSTAAESFDVRLKESAAATERLKSNAQAAGKVELEKFRHR